MYLSLPASACLSLSLTFLFVSLSPAVHVSPPSLPLCPLPASFLPSQSLCLCLGLCISACNFVSVTNFVSLFLSGVLSALLSFYSCFLSPILSLPHFLLNCTFRGFPPSICVLSLSVSASLPASLTTSRSLSLPSYPPLAVFLFLSLFQNFFFFSLFLSLHCLLTVWFSFSLFPCLSLWFLMFLMVLPCLVDPSTESRL